MLLKRNYAYFDQAGDAGAGGGAAAGAGAGDAGAGAGAGAGAAGAGAADAGSLLAAAAAAGAGGAGGQAAGAGAAGAAADPHAWIPEKYRVFEGEGDKKALNLEASAKKVAEAHGALEKRLGTTGAPPESAEGYKTEASLAALKTAAGGKDVPLPAEFVKEFSTWAHGAGLTQAQYDKALPALMGFIPQLMEQSFDNQMATAREELVKVWGAQGLDPRSPQMQGAYKAFMTYAPPTMRTPAEMDKVGNNPIVLQILAAVGKEMGEDKRVHGDGAEGDNVQTLMNSEAYWNKKHPEHASTVKRVNEFFARGGKRAA